MPVTRWQGRGQKVTRTEGLFVPGTSYLCLSLNVPGVEEFLSPFYGRGAQRPEKADACLRLDSQFAAEVGLGDRLRQHQSPAAFLTWCRQEGSALQALAL